MDTSAGSNLIREDLLPQQSLDELDRTREIVNLSSASKHRLDVLGITTLSVTVAAHTVRVPFVVMVQLGTDVILRCHYIEKAVDSIQVQLCRVLLIDASHVPIVCRRAAVPKAQNAVNLETINRRNPAPKNLIRCTERTVLAPESETNMSVLCHDSGLRLLEGFHSLYSQRSVTMLNVIMEIIPNVLFIVRVANLSKTKVTLSKNQKLGFALRAHSPDQVLAISFEDPGMTPDDSPHNDLVPAESAAQTDTALTRCHIRQSTAYS